MGAHHHTDHSHHDIGHKINHGSTHPINPRYALLASAWALGTVGILIAIKTYAYYLSGSAAMLGTLTDSVVDLAVSMMLLFAVRLSLKPADKQHRFGHGKVEGIAALMQGAFMAGAGIFLIFESTDRLIKPQELTHHKLTIIVALIAIALSFIVVWVQKFVLKRAPSLAIEADHAHYKTDIFLNGGVILAVGVSYYGGPIWLDPAIALLIAAYFLSTAWDITGKSLDMLMDKELPDDVRIQIEKIVEINKNIHGMHDLRTRMSGMDIHISFDVELDPSLTLQQAHDIVRDLDDEILKYYPNAEIIIHMDPIGDTSDPRHSVAGVHH
jgi:ferrous-iron efflux pump FieF